VVHASALAGSPPIAALVGDHQASLVGQGCTLPGLAKATFGTGGIFDLCLGAERPGHSRRGPAGTYPIVAWKRGGRITWGAEAIMLSAGSTVDYVCEELELADSPASTDAIAARAGDPVDVWFVPALAGLGTPVWDFGARGLLLGLTRDTTSPQIVRAMLEGIAHRGADLLDAAETDGDCHIDSLRVDGGMSANQSFLQYLADALWRPVEVSPVLEATTLGAAYLAGLAVGTWADEGELASLWQPRQVVEPQRRPDRERWLAARDRARSVIPELSVLQF
jgi:glycerol kinase